MNIDRFGTVSIWLGNFKSLGDLEEYVSTKYIDDGNAIESQFEKDFFIDYLDEDFMETNIQDEPMNEFSMIIEGHSYYNSIITNYTKQNLDKFSAMYNTSILAYDLNYNRDINQAKYGENSLTFIGNFQYDKRNY